MNKPCQTSHLTTKQTQHLIICIELYIKYLNNQEFDKLELGSIVYRSVYKTKLRRICKICKTYNHNSCIWNKN